MPIMGAVDKANPTPETTDRDILREFFQLSQSYPPMPEHQSILEQPYIVRKEIGGVRARFLIGNANARNWYDNREKASRDEVQPEHSSELEVIRALGLIREGSVAFDVGAHQGYFSICLSRWVGPRGHVYAFEPFPQNADLFRLNARLNGAANITVVDAAVGERTGYLLVTQDTQSAAFDGSPSNEVRCVALDDFAQLKPDFVKLDVEGFEAFALRGGKKLLAQHPNLGIELHHAYLRNYGSSVDEVLRLIDWRHYDAWVADRRNSTMFRPWHPGIPIRDELTSWIYARRKGERRRLRGAFIHVAAALCVRRRADAVIGKLAGHGWRPADIAVGSDGITHLLWVARNNQFALWSVSDSAVSAPAPAGSCADRVARRTDAGCPNGLASVLWRRKDRAAGLWHTSPGGAVEAASLYGPFPGWRAVDVAGGHDNVTRLLWVHDNQSAHVWSVADTAAPPADGPVLCPLAGWRPRAISASASDGLTRLLWTGAGGAMALWILDPTGALVSGRAFSPPHGWTAQDVASGGHDTGYILWSSWDGSAAIWTVAGSQLVTATAVYGPTPKWKATRLAAGPDGTLRIVWEHPDGMAALWTVASGGAFQSARVFGPF